VAFACGCGASYSKFNFLSKDQLTKKKDRILIKDLISKVSKEKNNLRFADISEGQAVLLQGISRKSLGKLLLVS